MTPSPRPIPQFDNSPGTKWTASGGGVVNGYHSELDIEEEAGGYTEPALALASAADRIAAAADRITSAAERLSAAEKLAMDPRALQSALADLTGVADGSKANGNGASFFANGNGEFPAALPRREPQGFRPSRKRLHGCPEPPTAPRGPGGVIRAHPGPLVTHLARPPAPWVPRDRIRTSVSPRIRCYPGTEPLLLGAEIRIRPRPFSPDLRLPRDPRPLRRARSPAGASSSGGGGGFFPDSTPKVEPPSDSFLKSRNDATVAVPTRGFFDADNVPAPAAKAGKSMQSSNEQSGFFDDWKQGLQPASSGGGAVGADMPPKKVSAKPLPAAAPKAAAGAGVRGPPKSVGPKGFFDSWNGAAGTAPRIIRDESYVSALCVRLGVLLGWELPAGPPAATAE